MHKTEKNTWVPKYKITDLYTYPKCVLVNVMILDNNYCLEEGESHSSYIGYYFDSPEAAFKAAFAEQHGYIKSSQERLMRLEEGFKRFKNGN